MKIAIIDSGIHSGHPHVGAVAGGIWIHERGWNSDTEDRLGHGTAVAGAIREKAPDAELFAVKVFDRRLSANIEVILRALAWCREQRMDIVNLSLGTANMAHRERFLATLDGSITVVSAANLLPGSLPGVVGVAADAACPRHRCIEGDGVVYASPYPRPIPGVPVEGNLQGVSFAVANVTGILAAQRMYGTAGDRATWRFQPAPNDRQSLGDYTGCK